MTKPQIKAINSNPGVSGDFERYRFLFEHYGKTFLMEIVFSFQLTEAGSFIATPTVTKTREIDVEVKPDNGE